ncbi:AarF/ABC1/UbiB kinase family protein [Oscillatoriales cyanobacterium LEGE 11467]|uniref:AarF/ABC1/UbiB kinase family protein n=1 Tax=Zarconia navalis LEGE 11467 TaxID=1828826 RepID=A0A928Z9P6_9CYAN|nr:AarF/ABC1/UbiB kinase family protein [Zarconia navalis]MBE9040976.1 AarF/ABC1/UbiB kinase family protein [Zarconia navalis LEGE 11467]
MNSNFFAQLRYYDADAIARYYRSRPWKAIWRTATVFWVAASFVLGWVWDELFDRAGRNAPKRAEQLRDVLTHLGPTFIKVGQALSTRPDLIRQDFLDELIKLQDRLPPFDNDLARYTIEKELGRSLDELYCEISPAPIAAASLAQVYRARLHTGEDVAVKVQRPNLKPTITLDLYLIRWGAKNFGRFLPLNLGHDLELIVDEFGIKLFEEVDYLNEGRNAEKFAANFSDNPQVKIPAIYWRYSSMRVLTLEWIQGYKLTGNLDWETLGIDPNSVIEVGVTSGLQQLLEHGFFHADPHPGNLFATAEGQMAYIDFGMMDQLEESMKENLVDALVHLINRDYQDLAADFVKLGFLTPDTDITPIIPALEEVLGDMIGQSVRDFNFKTVTDRFSELMYEYPFRVPAKFALIIRSVVTQEGLALSLNPDFKIVDIGYPYIARRLLTGESPELRRRLLEVLFEDGKFQWERLENLISIAQSDDNFDLLPTAGLGIQYLFSEEGQYLRRQLLLALTEDDRLHGEEVKRLWELVKDDVQPDRLWNVAIDAIAEFSAQRAASFLPSVAALNTFGQK